MMKKVLKIIAIIAAIAGAAAAVYVIIQKLKEKNAPSGYDEENYVSCSCLDDEFTAETVA
jgi:flagellar basal body-associated protein FliL